jgi:hypothetical protein
VVALPHTEPPWPPGPTPFPGEPDDDPDDDE